MPKSIKPLPALNEPDTARFWKYVEKRGPDECWPWKGTMSEKGPYGYGVLNVKHAIFLAHRISYALCNGDPSGLCVCHSCDNPPCCNPAHLFLGTQIDNMLDMNKKGRHASGEFLKARLHSPRGEQHGNSKLTAAQVSMIRFSYHHLHMRQAHIAASYGICQQQVSHIVTEKHWKAL